MAVRQKILLSWVVVVIAIASATFILNTKISFSLFATDLIAILICFLSLALMKYEPSKKNKPLFLNFAIFFSLSTLTLIFNFVVPYLANINAYLPLVVAQYLKGIYYFALAFSVVYLVVDSLFRDIRIPAKYIATSFITGLFFVLYFYNFISNPKYAYATDDVKDFIAVKNVYAQLSANSEREASPEEIANVLTLKAWKNNEAVGNLYPDKNLTRIKELYPYLEGTNYGVLIYKPINMYMVKMNVFVCFFIILFFGYQYKKDPPQGAYIDKMMFLILLFSSLEILHAWSYIYTVEWNKFTQTLNMGQYLTILVLLLLAGVLNARLRFVTSASGEFYESQLVSGSQHISRWRDWVDNLIVFSFFNTKAIEGILFSQRRKK